MDIYNTTSDGFCYVYRDEQFLRRQIVLLITILCGQFGTWIVRTHEINYFFHVIELILRESTCIVEADVVTCFTTVFIRCPAHRYSRALVYHLALLIDVPVNT